MAKNRDLSFGQKPPPAAGGGTGSLPQAPKASSLLALTPEQEEYQKRLRAAGLLLDSQGYLL